MRYQIARCDEYKDRDEQCGNIECHDNRNIEFHRRCVDIIAGRVEADETCLLLQNDKTKPDDVAPEKSAPNDEGSKP